MAKRKHPADRRQQKTHTLVERTARIMDISEDTAAGRLTIPLTQGVRLNPLQGSIDETMRQMRALGWQGDYHPWSDDGYTITTGYEALRDSSLVADGKIYIQNPSSWLPVMALDVQPGDRVLDVCAAPGGKASHIAARVLGEIDLVVNDNSRARLAKLQANLSRLGVQAEYTLYDATRLDRVMTAESFDRILLDAPCSGEGLINLDQPKSVDTWSVAHVRRLATLQKQLLRQAWRLLKPGGTLVYSTCTMAPEENEVVIDALLRRQKDAGTVMLPYELSAPLTGWNDRVFDPQVTRAGRVFPANGDEAFFVCKLRKKPNG